MKLEGKIKHGIALAIDHNDYVDCDVVYYGGMTIRLVNASYDDLSIAFGPVGSYVDMSAYYTKEEIDNKGYLTEHQDISGKADKATTYTKSEVDTALSGKQATLVSGTNIKTINNQSLLGSGNINIQGGGGVQSDWNVSDTSSMAYIKNKPTIPTVPSNVSAFTNDVGYLTQHQSLADYYTKTEVDTVLGGKANSADLASVATSGSYNDLSNKPTIPTVPTNVSAFNNDTGYLTTESDPTVPSWAKQSTKPSYTASEVGALPSTTFIPSKTSDLTNDSGFITGYTETDPIYSASVAAGITSSDISNWNSKTSNIGTITGITMNGTSKGTSGVVNLGTVVTSETDPVFTASAAHGITSSDIANWNSKTSNVGTITGITMNGASKGTSGVVDLGTVITEHQDISGKVDKETGKGLSSNDYTDAEKTKLSGIATGAEVNVQSDWNQTTTTADDYIKNKPSLATVATSGSYNDLSNKPTIPTVPTNVSAFNNDAGYLTQHQSLDNYYTKSEVNSAIVDSNPVIEDTRSSAVAAITGVAPFDTLVDGQRIVVKLKYTTLANATLTLTGLTNALPIYARCNTNNNSDITPIYVNGFVASSYMELIYDATNSRWICTNYDRVVTYEALTQSRIDSSSTAQCVITGKLLRDNFYLKSEINTMIGDIETLLASI